MEEAFSYQYDPKLDSFESLFCKLLHRYYRHTHITSYQDVTNVYLTFTAYFNMLYPTVIEKPIQIFPRCSTH